MTNPLHAQHYADRAVQATVEIIENMEVARDTWRLRFACPAMARRILPGQFLMVRVSNCDDPLIGRPLAMYDVLPDGAGRPHAIDVVYIVKGKFTTRAQRLQPGHQVDVWGPLGNGFPPCPAPMDSATHLIMVAGGIGYTPFLAVAKEVLGRQRYGDPKRDVPRANQVTFCYGARTADYLAGIQDFEAVGVDLRISTDDGSRGHHGLVTDLLSQTLNENSGDSRVVCCGPEPMMEAAAQIAKQRNVPCQVSLETPMACGIGICFSCVAKVTDDEGEWDYKRTCVEGPVFDAAKIVW